MPKTMDALELRTILSAQKADALAAVQSAKLSSERERADRYYLGDMTQDLPSEEGRSSAVSSDVADTIEGLMPSLMDIFAGSDEVVRFEPVGAEDEKAAQQETDYVNHVFMQRNPGFMVLYSFIKDALLSKVGIVKVWWETREEEQRETYFDLTEDQFALLAQGVLESGGALEIIEHTEKADEATGIPLHDVTVLQTKEYAQARVLGVPPEEFGIERNARTIRDCNYCFHDIVTKTRSQLIVEGYDENQINALPDYNGLTNEEELARDSVWESSSGNASSTNKASQPVRITEHYARLDYNGDGKPQLYQIVTGGDQGEVLKRDGKLAIEPVDFIPFAAATPIPVTHRFFGRSVADLVIEIQKIKTALMRGLLDNLYLHNDPRVEVAEDHANANTLDDLLVSRRGGIVRTKTPGGINPLVPADITGAVYPALAYMDSVREMRTGVTRQGQGVDANALQNQSATAVAQVFTASQARMKLIARILAEGVRDIFSLLHATIRKHGQAAQTVRLRKEWVEVDPRQWKTRDDMTINVGLGTGGKGERVAHLMALANYQKELLLGGKTNLVDDVKLFNTFKELARLMDYRSPDQFINDPMAVNEDGSPKYPPPQPQPDPKIMQLQMQAELNKQSDERKAQIEAVQAKADIETQNRKTDAEMVQSERDFQLKREMAILEFELQERLAMAEEARKQREHELKLEQQRQAHEYAVAKGEMSLMAGAQKAQQNGVDA
jgi:hypothetical protein